jgi:hypothetical protein
MEPLGVSPVKSATPFTSFGLKPDLPRLGTLCRIAVNSLDQAMFQKATQTNPLHFPVYLIFRTVVVFSYFKPPSSNGD